MVKWKGMVMGMSGRKEVHWKRVELKWVVMGRVQKKGVVMRRI